MPLLAVCSQPIVRRLITRLLGIVPATVVAVAVGRKGIDTMMVASQVALSIVLPFVIFPLVIIASSPAVMNVTNPPGVPARDDKPDDGDSPATHSFTSHWVSQVVGYLLFALVTVANCYVILMLIMGKA